MALADEQYEKMVHTPVWKLITQLATGSSIKIETLETTWKTIMNGIEETQAIQNDAKKQRADAKDRLEQIKADFYKNYHIPS